jgi:hypothetical protein
MEERKLQFKEKYLQIYKITEVTISSKEFDSEGDDDILEINFAGKIIRNIKRSILTKPPCCWNLFSCLFHKRWDAFHPRDKEGRIYVDLEEEWISPLLDYMMYYQAPVSYIQVESSTDIPFSEVFEYFQLSSSFLDEPYCPSRSDFDEKYPLIGNELLVDYGDHGEPLDYYSSKIGNNFKARGYKHTELKKLGFHYSGNSSNEGDVHSNNSIDLTIYKQRQMRGIELLMVVETKNGESFVLNSNACCLPNTAVTSGFPTHDFIIRKFHYGGSEIVYPYEVIKRNPSNTIEVSEVISLFSPFLQTSLTSFNEENEDSSEKTLFPMIFLRKRKNSNNYTIAFILKENGDIYTNDCDYYLKKESNCRKVEIYEVKHYKRNRILKQTTNSCAQSALSLSKITPQKESENPQYKKFYEKTFENENEKYNSAINSDSIDEELSFMKQYFQCVYDLTEKEKEKEKEDNLEFFTRLWQHIKKQNATGSRSLNPIIYFNSDCEVLPILRSTITRNIPNSQLDIRISGRWNEQDQTDIDKDGNLIISTCTVHPSAFTPIFFLH